MDGLSPLPPPLNTHNLDSSGVSLTIKKMMKKLYRKIFTNMAVFLMLALKVSCLNLKVAIIGISYYIYKTNGLKFMGGVTFFNLPWMF